MFRYLRRNRISQAVQTLLNNLFNYTSLQVNGDNAANNSQNNTFLDSSSNNLAITRNGNVTQGSISPFSQSGWSGYFNGSSHISATIANQVNLSTQDFTMEGWFNSENPGVVGGLISRRAVGIAEGWTLKIETNNRLEFACLIGGSWTQQLISSVTTITQGTWYHAALTRQGSTFRLFINGNLEATVTNANAIQDIRTLLSLGSAASTGVEQGFKGFLSNFRLVIGSALYTASFTPSTDPIANVAGTALLTLQDKTFKDNSASGLTFALTGTVGFPRIMACSPFVPKTDYSTYIHGSSLYFDGVSDFLTIPGTSALEFGGGNFTVEFWFYTLSTARQWFYQAATSASFGIDYNSKGTNTLGLWFSTNGYTWNSIQSDAGGNGSGSNVLPIGQWNHIAVTRSGNVWTMFLNGAIDKQLTAAGSLIDRSVQAKQIGSRPDGLYPVNGHISNFRIVKGTALYTAAFTPPAAPLTTVPDTQLLLSGSNSGVTDVTGKNVLETVGTAKVSTDTKKFNTGSIYFNGTTDYIKVANSPEFAYNTGDFTIEMWINAPTGSTYRQLVSHRLNDSTLTGNGAIMLTPTNGLAWFTSAFHINTSTPIPLNQWVHVAIVRFASVLTLFVNGSPVSSVAYTQNLTSMDLTIGANADGTQLFSGYMDDIRVTKGKALYTGDFTPPALESSIITDAKDPYFNQNLLVLQANGANYGNNSTFVDRSNNGFAVTRNGTPTQGSFSPFSNNGWSHYVNAAATVWDKAAFLALGSSTAYTIDFWIKPTLKNNIYGGVIYGVTASGRGDSTWIAHNPNGTVGIINAGIGYTNLSSNSEIPLNVWTHVAISISGQSGLATGKIFINGVLDKTVTGMVTAIADVGANAASGTGHGNANYNFYGFISDFRITRGVVRFVNDFIPPTAPAVADADTTLLIYSSKSLVNKGTAASALISNATANSVQPVSPFAVTAAYSTALHGGSMYFNGSTDYLAPAVGSSLNPGTGNITRECWFYATALQTNNCLFSNYTNTSTGATVGIENGKLVASFSGSAINIQGTTNITTGQWYHVAVSGQQGSYKMFLNGVQEGATYTGTVTSDTSVFTVGAVSTAAIKWFTGFITDVRVTKAVLYNSAFTPPIAPLAVVANMQLLLSGTNAAIFDATGHVEIESGAVILSAAQSKFGSNSLRFNGNVNSHLKLINNPLWNFGTSDFTIELWYYKTAQAPSNGVIFSTVNVSTQYTGIQLLDNAGTLNMSMSSNGTSWDIANLTSLGTLALSTWHHIVIRRTGIGISVFLNGVLKGTVSSNAAVYYSATQTPVIGGHSDVTRTLFGHIDDVRITLGKSRYTIEPTAALPTRG